MYIYIYTIPMIIQYYQVLIIYYHDMYIRVLLPVSTMLSTCKVMLVTDEVLSLGGTIWTPRTTQGHHRPGCRSDFTRSRLCQGTKATPCISVVVQSPAEPFWNLQQRQLIPAVHCTNGWDMGIF